MAGHTKWEEIKHKRALAAEEKLALVLAYYEGKWVAVRNHKVVASAAELQALIDKIEADKIEIEVIFKVQSGEGPRGPSIFDSRNEQ